MLSEFWSRLPASVKITLLQGTVGREQLLRLARLCLREMQEQPVAANEYLPDLARNFLLAAWEADPLNGELAADLLNLSPGRGLQSDLLRAVRQHFALPSNLNSLEQAIQKGDLEQETALILAGLKAEAGNLYWARALWKLGWRESRAELLEEALFALGRSEAPSPLTAFLKAQFHLAQRAAIQAASLGANQALDQVELALCSLNTLPGQGHPDSLPSELSAGEWLAPLELKSGLLALLGENAAAQSLGRTVLAVRPWHSSLALTLYDRHHARSGRQLPPGKIVLLLYTWNKAADLDLTLAALAPASGLLHKIIVLNNGSSDNTAQVLAAWAERLGKVLEVVTLPVNIGAPAARNWLRGHEIVAASDFVIFLDDDALVCGGAGADWLQAFGQAAAAYPDAAAYGLKIIDYSAPHTNQSADLHLLCLEPGAGLLPSDKLAERIIADEEAAPNAPDNQVYALTRARSRSFEVVNPAQGAADLGLFDYIRPCASVTGCCHMFRTGRLLKDGAFNLSFSPSQYDDLERDLRLAAEGAFACYSGLGRVWHLQRTGRGRKMSPAAYGSSLGNEYKLAAHFSQGRAEAIMRSQFRILEQDLLFKLKAVG